MPTGDRSGEEQGGHEAFDLGIPGYEDARVIGRGGFAVVCRARQRSFDRTVAVKVLTPLDVDDEARRRFERECRAMGGLSWHPNIVTVFDAGATAVGRPYLTMEYVPGGSLGDRLARDGPRPWDEATAVGAAIAGALEAAHRAGRLHRDIKPENILVSQFGEPKLTDFGIAVIQGATQTAKDGITATLAHAAPEILSGKRATVSSDVYSLGSTLFQLLAGKPAFIEDSDESLLPLYHRVDTAPVPDLRPRGVPEGMCQVVERAMAKDPRQRFASAEELGAGLQNVQTQNGLAPTLMRVGEAEQTPPVGEAAVLPAVPGTSDETITAPRSLMPEPTTPGGPGRRRRVPVWAALVGGAAVVALVIAGVAVLAGGGGGGASRSKPRPAAAPAPTSVPFDNAAFVGQLETLLEQSAPGRTQVIDIYNGVLGCEKSAAVASSGMRNVITNREKALNDLNRIATGKTAEADNLVSMLRAALQHSLDSNNGYLRWIDATYTPFFNSGRCGSGPVPTDSAFNAGQEASAQATAAKQSFVAAFNPVAARFGMRQWNDVDF
jgi:hypothetical protein